MGPHARSNRLFWGPALALIAVPAPAEANLPPVRDSFTELTQAWIRSAADFEGCSARASEGGRSGTVWVNLTFTRAGLLPTFKLRTAGHLAGTDRACVGKVLRGLLLPRLKGAYQSVSQPLATKELFLGKAPSYLPPIGELLPDWIGLVREPSRASRRAAVQRRVGSEVKVTSDGCLERHREEGLQASRRQWLQGDGPELPELWRELIDQVALPFRIRGAAAFAVDGALLLTGSRSEGRHPAKKAGGVSATSPIPDQTRMSEATCLLPFDDSSRRALMREIEAITDCVPAALPASLVSPHIEWPSGKTLHGVTMADTRSCGLDENGALVCCGVHKGQTPAGAFRAVAVDDKYSCAITSTDEVRCWGDPARGASPPEGHFSRVVVHAAGACGLKSDGSLTCWGVPTTWAAPPAGRFIDVALTGTLVSAVRPDGTFVSWGMDAGSRALNATVVLANDCQTCVLDRHGTAACRDDQHQDSTYPGPWRSFTPACRGGCGLLERDGLRCAPAGAFAFSSNPALSRGAAEVVSTPNRLCVFSPPSTFSCTGVPWPGPSLLYRQSSGEAPVRAMATATPAGADLQWLMGRWRQPVWKGHWGEVVWTRTDEGVRGTFDTVFADGTRSPVAVYLIREAGKRMTLTVQRFPDASTWFGDPTTERVAPRHSSTSSSPLTFLGGIVADKALRFERRLPRAASKDDPVYAEISQNGPTLYVQTAPVRRRVATLWDRYTFTRGAGEATPPPADRGHSHERQN